MLNIKKGLAVALAAATVLTFAPTSAFAGTSIGKQVIGKEPLLATMNETANVWSYATNDTTSPAAYSISDEQGAYVVLTPSDPDGSVTFTENVTTKDSTALENGQWFEDHGSDSLTKNVANKEAGSVLQLTSAKNSKTLKITASVAKLRALTIPAKYVIDSSNVAGADLVPGLKVTVILVNHAVKMNNLKVTLSNGGDSALSRYQNGSSDEFDAFEARPNDTVTGADFDVSSVDTAKPIKTREAISTVELNLATGNTTKTFQVESNADVKYKSDDENVATIDKDGIHAKGVGETTVYVRTKQSLTAYGEVEVKIPVKVINKPKATLSAPEELYVHGYGKANETTIGATGTNIQKYSIRYQFVYWNPLEQKFETYASDHNNSVYAYDYAKLNPYKLDESKDTVYVLDYTGDDNDLYNWNSYLEVSATGADGYADPDPILVKLRFVKNSSLFTLDSNKQYLHVGESVQITTRSVTAVTGAAFSYKSINPAVATVSDTGVIKAVSEGFTQVEVSYGGDKQYVTVQVTNYENGTGSTETPAKVTGVKVSNKKGAKVTVKFNKVTTAPTMKYYVQKKVSGKTAGKSVGSAKTTLSVKKGATVKVRVKAYYYDVNGDKHVGAYSAWRTLKTDKK